MGTGVGGGATIIAHIGRDQRTESGQTGTDDADANLDHGPNYGVGVAPGSIDEGDLVESGQAVDGADGDAMIREQRKRVSHDAPWEETITGRTGRVGREAARRTKHQAAGWPRFAVSASFPAGETRWRGLARA